MEARPAAFALSGTIMHTPRRGAVEIIEGALVEVGRGGVIEKVTAPRAGDFAQRRHGAASAAQ